MNSNYKINPQPASWCIFQTQLSTLFFAYCQILKHCVGAIIELSANQRYKR